MGIYINLSIMPDKINKKQWKKVYLETLKLIENYPVMGIREGSYHGLKKLVYSSDVEHNINQPEKRYWKVSGNIEKKTSGETFVLYYDINNYRYSPEYNCDDILYLFLNKDSKPFYIFDRKTQGEDYHKFILAVAILIENRFPHKAIVHGDITKKEAKNSIKWANKILNEDLDMPVLLNGTKLIDRVIQIEKNNDEIIKTIYLNYMGDSEEILKILMNKFSSKEIGDWIKKYTKKFKSPKKVGVINLFIIWLNTTKNLEKLMEITCYEDGGPEFEIEEFIESLILTWAFIPEKYQKKIQKLHKIEKDINNVPFNFVKIILDSGLAGRKIKVNFKKYELMKLLEKYVPERKKELSNFFEKRLSKEINILEENESLLRKVTNIIDKDNKGEKNNSQKKQRNFEKEIKSLKEKLEEHKSLMKEKNYITLEDKKRLLIKRIYENRVVLTEEAWENIENCQNEDIIIFLILLYSLKENAKEFCISRKMISENLHSLDDILT